MPIDGASTSIKTIDGLDPTSSTHQSNEDFDTGTGTITTPQITTDIITSTGPSISFTAEILANYGLTIPNNLYSLFKSVHSQSWSNNISQLCQYQAVTTQIDLPNATAPTLLGSIFTFNKVGTYLVNAQHVYRTSSTSTLGNEYNTWIDYNVGGEKLGWIRHTIQGSIGALYFVRQTSVVINAAQGGILTVNRIQNSGLGGLFGYDDGVNEFGYISFLKLN
jgi:hypothetical protein